MLSISGCSSESILSPSIRRIIAIVACRRLYLSSVTRIVVCLPRASSSSSSAPCPMSYNIPTRKRTDQLYCHCRAFHPLRETFLSILEDRAYRSRFHIASQGYYLNDRFYITRISFTPGLVFSRGLILLSTKRLHFSSRLA